MRGTRDRLRMGAGLLVAGALALSGCDSTGPATAQPPSASPTPARTFTAGADGVGDTYFPTYGNGGYDVGRYTVKVRYDPAKDQLTGTTTVRATATADLSTFNLDLAGLTVSAVTVDGAPATHSRKRNELVIKPAAGLINGNGFVAEITYAGKPKPLRNETLGDGGFLHTADGAIALGQPESASTWFPVNDHPSDKAAYDFEVTVPDGLTAISNGVPGGKASTGGWTTWKWSEKSPMASYLSTLVIGKFRITTGEHKGRPVYNAVTTTEAKGNADASIARTVEVADYLESVFGPYPFDAYGGVVISDRRISLRAGDAEPTGLRGELLPAGREHRGRRARAGPPVVRRQRRVGQVGGHLAQRGLRDVRGVAVGRAHQGVHRQGGVRQPVRRAVRAGVEDTAGQAGRGRSCSASRSTSAAA